MRRIILACILVVIAAGSIEAKVITLNDHRLQDGGFVTRLKPTKV